MKKRERERAVPKLDSETLMVSEKIRLFARLSSLSDRRSVSMLRCSTSSDSDAMFSTTVDLTEVKGLITEEMEFEWSWNNSGGTSTFTPGGCWLMVAWELRLHSGWDRDKREGRALLWSCKPKYKVSVPPELAVLKDLWSLTLLRCCAAISAKEAVVSQPRFQSWQKSED